jgi:hypothetical protein
MNKIIISRIPNLNVLIIKLVPNSRFFISTKDSFIISVPNFSALIKHLVKGGFISIKVLEGIISELKE